MASGGLRKVSSILKRQDQAQGGVVDPMLKPGGSAGNDALGAYPTQIRIPVLEGRRYLWTTRAFALGFYISMTLNIVLAFLIYTMLPLKKIEPFLVTFNDKNEQVVQVQPFIKNNAGFYLMTEKLAGEYVKMREEIIPDGNEMLRRWGEYVQFYTEKELFQEFVAQVKSPFEVIKAKGFSRRVDIDKIERRNDGYVEVYFKTIDANARGEEVERRQWIAQINYAYLTQNIRVDKQYINPLGFTATGYSLREN
jgi:type IV secretory pathway component VirB8